MATYQAWDGEDYLWLLPGIEASFSWTEEVPGGIVPRKHTAIPSTFYNCITIYHIDAERRLYPELNIPAELKGAGPQQLKVGLFRQWITSVQLTREFGLDEHGPLLIDEKMFDVPIPVRSGNKVHIEHQKLPNMARAEDETQRINIIPAKCWSRRHVLNTLRRALPARLPPPEPTPTMNLFGKPQDELHIAFYPDHVQISQTYRSYATLEPPFRVVFRPFSELFPNWAGVYTFYLQYELTCLIESSDDTDEKLRKATLAIAPYLSYCRTTVAKAWLPRALNNPDGTVRDLQMKYDVEHQTIAAVLNDPCAKDLHETVEVPRVWGWAAYFLWEYLNDLSQHIQVRLCRVCGQPIRGTAAKTVCACRPGSRSVLNGTSRENKRETTRDEEFILACTPAGPFLEIEAGGTQKPTLTHMLCEQEDGGDPNASCMACRIHPQANVPVIIVLQS